MTETLAVQFATRFLLTVENKVRLDNYNLPEDQQSRQTMDTYPEKFKGKARVACATYREGFRDTRRSWVTEAFHLGRGVVAFVEPLTNYPCTVIYWRLGKVVEG